MKKIMLFAIAAVTMCMTACTGCQFSNDANCEDSTVVDTTVVDTVELTLAVDTLALDTVDVCEE